MDGTVPQNRSLRTLKDFGKGVRAPLRCESCCARLIREWSGRGGLISEGSLCGWLEGMITDAPAGTEFEYRQVRAATAGTAGV